MKSTIITYHVYDHVSVVDVFQTILDLSACDHTQSFPYSFVKLYKQAHCVSESETDLKDDSSLSETALATLHNYTMIINSTNELDHSQHADQQQMIWHVESEDMEAIIEAYVNSEEATNSLCLRKDLFYNRHVCLFHYYNVQKPMAITYQGRYKIVYTNYYGE